MVMYPAKAGTSFSIMVKLFIYMFLGSTIFIFLHDGIMHNNILNEVKDSKGDELFSSMNEKNRQESSADIVYGEKKVLANATIKEEEPKEEPPKEKEITGGVRLTTKHNSLYKSPFTL